MQHTARLTAGFRERCASTGLTDAALAAAIGVSRQFFNRVKNGHESPSVAFMAGAIHAGLATTFAEVAEPTPPLRMKDAAARGQRAAAKNPKGHE